jgi:hypothetical protein
MPLFAVVGLAIGVTRTPDAHGETFNVPCDVAALASVIAAVNTNRQEDFVWLGPSCVYSLAETWFLQPDFGNPVRIYGRGATISGNDERTPIIVGPGATVHLNDATVTEGMAADGFGGAIQNFGTLTLTDCTVSDSAAANAGGGISNGGNARLTVTHSTISGNRTEAYGGGIANIGRLTVTSSTISANGANLGGGIFNEGRAALFNSTLVSNGGGSRGGGILNHSTGTLELNHVTVSYNGAVDGGNVRNDGQLDLNSSLLASHLIGGDCVNEGTITPAGGNMIEDASCAIGGAISGDPEFFGFSVGEPGFLPLVWGSPAIDAGDNSRCPGVDQRGFPRPQDGFGDGTATCDLGAYESACGLLGVELFLVLPLVRGFARARAWRCSI